jgi:hypothetical protein
MTALPRVSPYPSTDCPRRTPPKLSGPKEYSPGTVSGPALRGVAVSLGLGLGVGVGGGGGGAGASDAEAVGTDVVPGVVEASADAHPATSETPKAMTIDVRITMEEA